MKSFLVPILVFLLLVAAGCSKKPMDYAGLKQRADRLFDTGSYADAKKLYLQAMQLNRHDPDLYLRLGNIAFKQANFREVFSHLKQAKKLDPENPESCFLLGSAHCIEGRYKKAIPLLEETLRLQPRHTWAMETLGAAYYGIGRTEDAFRVYTQLAAIEPENKFVRTYLGLMHLESGNYDMAQKELLKGSQINPTYAENFYWLSWLAERSGSLEQAIKYLQQAIDRSPEDSTYHAYLGRLHCEKEDYQAALKATTKALVLNPENQTAKEYKEIAKQRLKRGNSLPTDLDWAEATFREGNIKGAIRAFEDLYAAAPQEQRIRDRLPNLYKLSGDWGKARALYEQLLKVDPNDRWAENHLYDLEEQEDFIHRVEVTWEKAAVVETKHFIVKTNLPGPLQERVVEKADALFELTATIIKDVLGIPTPALGKIKLHIMAKPQEYFAYWFSKKKLSASWHDHQGYFSIERNEIVFSFDHRDHVEALAHEFSHALLWRSFERDIPNWLGEGMAEYVLMKIWRGRYFRIVGNDRLEDLQAAIKDGSFIRLPNLIELETHEHELFYDAAWSLVTFLAERSTQQGIQGSLKDYCSRLRQKGYASKTFWDVFGNPRKIEREWKKFIKALIADPGMLW